MFDMFSFIDPIVDQDTFIAQLEEILESPEPADPQGNRYELYLLLQRLKAGGISFEQFLAQAKAWAQEGLERMLCTGGMVCGIFHSSQSITLIVIM